MNGFLFNDRKKQIKVYCTCEIVLFECYGILNSKYIGSDWMYRNIDTEGNSTYLFLITELLVKLKDILRHLKNV